MVEGVLTPFESFHTGTVTVVMAASASSLLEKRRLSWLPKRRRYFLGFSPCSQSRKSWSQ